jgi:hypothetical protein
MVCGWRFLAACLLGSNIIGQYTYMYINKWCSRVNTLQFWIQMRHKQKKKIFSVYAKIWTPISKINNKRINKLCHTATILIYYFLRSYLFMTWWHVGIWISTAHFNSVVYCFAISEPNHLLFTFGLLRVVLMQHTYHLRQKCLKQLKKSNAIFACFGSK